MNEDMIKKVIAAFGVTEEEMHEANVYDVIVKTSIDLARLVLYVNKYEVMTPESRERLSKIIRQYLTDLETILLTETDIERLRQSE